MSWWQLVPALGCAVLILFVPGYLVVRAWGMSGLVAAGAAAPISASIMAGSAVLGPFLGLRWSPLLPLWPTLVLGVLGLTARWSFPHWFAACKPSRRRPWRSRWTLLAHLGALAIPAVLITRGLITMIGAPENISQTYDAIFHLNAVRYILDSGSGSSLTLGGMYSNGAHPGFYPGAWHDVVSVVVQLSGASIPMATNAVVIAVGALVWPVAAIFLTTRVTGNKPAPVLLAGALAAGFGALPYLMVDFGVLYPMYLSLALLPSVLALASMAFAAGDRGLTPAWLAVLVLLGAIPGLALAHPSSFLAVLVFVIPMALVVIVRHHRGLRARRAHFARHLLPIFMLLIYLLVLLKVWVTVRPSAASSQWAPFQSTSQAVGQVLSAGLIDEGASWIILALTLVGIGLTLRGRMSWWLLSAYGLAAAFFVVASAFPKGSFRSFVSGVWYNDSYRLAAQLPVFGVVFATVAATWLLTRCSDTLTGRIPRVRRLAPCSTPPTTPLAALLVFVLAAVMGYLAQYSSVRYEIVAGQSTYVTTPDAPALSADERQLLDRLDTEVPRDATIIGNPWTGTALAYAIADRRTLTPQLGSTPPPRIDYLMNHFNEVSTSPRLCSTIRTLHSFYVLQFDGVQMHKQHVDFPGLDTLASNPGVVEIDHQGPWARLYRVTACR